VPLAHTELLGAQLTPLAPDTADLVLEAISLRATVALIATLPPEPGRLPD
jgi:hypothetical protein